VQDITLQKYQEREQKLLSQRLLTTIEYMTDAFYMLDRDWRVIYINDAADELVGRFSKQSLGGIIWEEFPHLVGTKLYEGYHRALRDSVVFHHEYFSSLMDNWIELDAHPSPEGLAVYFRPVSEEKKMTARIAASERRLNYVTQATLDAAWDWNLEDNTIWWSGGLQRLFGYQATEGRQELETDRQFWTDLIHPADRSRVLREVERMLRGKEQEWESQYRLQHREGHFVHVHHKGFVLRDAQNGYAQQVIGGITDISERLALAERMLQAQRLESVGRLTGHVAHDFNNLLTIILGNAELLREVFANHPLGSEMAGMISDAALKGSDLTRRLLTFARKQTLEPLSIDINQLVENLRPMLSRTLGVNIDVQVSAATPLPPVLVDAHELEGALLNLCLNARDAMADGGALTLETAAAEVTLDQPGLSGELQPGTYLMLTVSDTGSGIAPEHMSRLFEPFFTTKPTGKGTGLGLSSVFSFIKQSRGHITIDSVLGQGTSIKLYLPVSTRAAETLPRKDQPATGGRETILIVDDDQQVLDIAVRLLGTTLGYQVHAAVDAASALALLQQGTSIDLVFTDLMMPGMNGREFASVVQQLRPDLRFLFTSGFAEHSPIPGTALDSNFPLLPKPYLLSELARKVREVLDRE